MPVTAPTTPTAEGGESSFLPRLPSPAFSVFRPPLPNVRLQRVVNRLLPLLCKTTFCDFQLQVDEASLQRLASLQLERVLLLPNHPNHMDALVMLELSRRMNRPFYYLVAREVFNIAYGLFGVFLQRLGCYSVVRGGLDRDSLQTTKALLAENWGPLVIFPEGRISHQAHAVLPVELGSIQLAFHALHEAYRNLGGSLSVLPSLYIVPVAIRYVAKTPAVSLRLGRRMGELEEALGLEVNPYKPYEQRLWDMGGTVLAQLASRLNLSFLYDASLSEQMDAVNAELLTRLEGVLGLPVKSGQHWLERTRAIRNAANKWRYESSPEAVSVYAQRLDRQQEGEIRYVQRMLEQVVHVNILCESLNGLDNKPEQEEETLRMLERIVLGTSYVCQSRTAVVRIGEPVDLKTLFPAYLEDRRGTVGAVSQYMQTFLTEAIR